ncbi:hypothetical protein DFH28DRAFT_1082903 [Melampsora americana]|nr:hypothetical protein DFH28DRAFT_1082903 [Melampsora americana]
MMDWKWSTALYPAQNLTEPPHHSSSITLASPKTKTNNLLSKMTTSNPTPSLDSFQYNPSLHTAISSSSLWDHQQAEDVNHSSEFSLPSDYNLNSTSSSSSSQSYHLLNSNGNLPSSSHPLLSNTNTSFNMTSSSNHIHNQHQHQHQSHLYPISPSSHSTSLSLPPNHQHIQQQQQQQQQQLSQPVFYAR